MGKLYVHCGLHKTATTALQTWLSTHADEFIAAGFLYPRAGRPVEIDGHHNIAWQLTHDRRFDRRVGDLDALFNEIGDFSGDVILSSEDFEGLFGHGQRWFPLLRRANAVGKSVVFLIYLRNQVSYLESLYQEMLGHGFGEEYRIFVDAALGSGTLRMKEWEFHFDYSRIAAGLSVLPDSEVVFRNYHALVNGSPFSDFLAAVSADLIQIENAGKKENVRDPVEKSLAHFYENRLQCRLSEHQRGAVNLLCRQDLHGVTTNGSLWRALSLRFTTANAEICHRYAIPSAGLVWNAGDVSPSEPGASIDKVFSFETHVTLQDIALMLADNASKESHREREIERIAQQWSAWIRS